MSAYPSPFVRPFIRLPFYLLIPQHLFCVCHFSCFIRSFCCRFPLLFAYPSPFVLRLSLFIFHSFILLSLPYVAVLPVLLLLHFASGSSLGRALFVFFFYFTCFFFFFATFVFFFSSSSFSLFLLLFYHYPLSFAAPSSFSLFPSSAEIFCA